MLKYIYILNLKIKFDIFGSMFMEDDIHNEIYYDYIEAKSKASIYIKESINKYKRITKCTNIIFNKDIFIDYNITVVSCNYLNKSTIELLSYYNENKNSIKKKDLYDFLLSITGKEFIRLDHKGYPGLCTVKEGFADDLFCSKSLYYNKKYHLNKFKIGDKVKVKVPFEDYEKVYEIFDIINKENSIYDSDDPLHFRQGYALTDIYNDYCNKYTQLHFDEDLIKSTDEEYNNYYKL